MKHVSTDEIWTTEEAAAYLKLHPNTVRDMAKQGELPHKRVGASKKVFRFSRRQILLWVEGRK